MPTWYFGHNDPKESFRKHLMESPPSAICIDTETTSLDDKTPLGFSISISPEESFYFGLRPQPPRELELLQRILSDPQIVKIAHNWMFDLKVFPRIPVCGQWLDTTNLWDTNVAARLIGHILTSLSVLAPWVGRIAQDAGELIKSRGKKTMADLDDKTIADKCENDARVTHALYRWLLPQIESKYKEYFRVEMEVIPLLTSISNVGLKIDQGARKSLENILEGEIRLYHDLIVAQGVNLPSSPQQVGYVLATRGNFLPFTSKKQNQLCTDESVLQMLDDPLAQLVLSYRHVAKLKNTYIAPLEGLDRIHTDFNLDAVVGRISSSRRNLQNYPPATDTDTGARYIFVPDSGTFTNGDFSQEHLYILMHNSGDMQMKRVYEDGEFGGDIHAYTAQQMFGTVTKETRRLAKTVNYAIIYGADAKTVCDAARIRDTRRGSRLLESWFDTFKEAAYWIKVAKQDGLRSGWSLPTLFGRRIRIPMDEGKEAAERKAVNYPILGSDGEVIKRAIVLCNDRKLGPPTLVLTMHDNLMWDGDVQPPVEEIEMVPGFRIPFKLSKSTRWE